MPAPAWSTLGSSPMTPSSLPKDNKRQSKKKSKRQQTNKPTNQQKKRNKEKKQQKTFFMLKTYALPKKIEVA